MPPQLTLRRRGFTLVEMIMVIILMLILSAVAFPRFVDIYTEARRSAVNSALGAVRTAISLYVHRQAMPPPIGSNRPYYPTLALLQMSQNKPGIVFAQKMPENPFCSDNDLSARRRIVGKDAAVADGVVPDPGENVLTGAWAYDSFMGAAGSSTEGEAYVEPPDGFDVGRFWADTHTKGIQEFKF
ncbi:MAG: type II secretion system protein [Planctomycetes bacterium]|nr:type II secretion system protein [Planctomycetota bacterium]